jgi:hypothetical protein
MWRRMSPAAPDEKMNKKNLKTLKKCLKKS